MQQVRATLCILNYFHFILFYFLVMVQDLQIFFEDEVEIFSLNCNTLSDS
jgi:hypothetical protein